jgi:hypothetical protein
MLPRNGCEIEIVALNGPYDLDDSVFTLSRLRHGLSAATGLTATWQTRSDAPTRPASSRQSLPGIAHDAESSQAVAEGLDPYPQWCRSM